MIDQVDYPLKISNQSMMYFEEFFDIPYSLPKSGILGNWIDGLICLLVINVTYSTISVNTNSDCVFDFVLN